jgi:hypothetical protein
VPVEAEVHDKQRGKSEGDDTDSGEGITQVAPITGPEVEHTAGDKSEGDGVGAGHPLTVLEDLPIARGEEGGGRANDPGGGLHRGSREARTAGRKGNPGCGADKDGDDVDAAEDAMEFKVTLAKSRGELDGAAEQSDDAAQRMRDEELTVGDDLQTVSVVHGVVGDEEDF